MMNLLSRMSIEAYLRAKGFAAGLKNDERGISGIVVAVILVLVAVVLGVAFQKQLTEFVTDLWNRIFNAGDELSTNTSFGSGS